MMDISAMINSLFVVLTIALFLCTSVCFSFLRNVYMFCLVVL